MHCELPTTLAALKEGKWGLEGKGWGEGKGGGEGKNQCAHKKLKINKQKDRERVMEKQ